MELFLNKALREALDATCGDPEESYKLVRAKLDEASTSAPDVWDEIDWMMSESADDIEGFLRVVIDRSAERWRRRRNRPPLKPPPRMR